MKLTEKQIETQILNYLSIEKGALFYKINNTGIYDTQKKTFRTVVNKYSPKGISDIVGSYYSRAVFIEVKTPEAYTYLVKHYDELRIYIGDDKKKTHLKNQIHFIESNKRMGNIALFACSLDQVKEGLEK